MYRYRFSNSLRGKLFLLLLTVLVPVLLIQAGYSYNRYQSRRANELQANVEVARAVADTFDEFVRAVVHQELAIGANLTMPQFIPVEQMNRILEVNRSEHPALRDISWVSPHGRIIASSAESLIGEDLSDRLHIREIFAGKQWILSNLLLSRRTGRPIFFICRAILDEEKNLLGIVSTGVVPEKLGDMLGVELSKGGAITLIDREGKAVCQFPETEWKWEARDLLDKRPAIREALSGKEVIGSFPCFATAEERMVALSPSRSTGWVISAGRLEQAVIAPIKGEIMIQAGLSFLVTIGVFLIAVAVSRNITAPIKSLQEHALMLGHGDLKHRAEIRGSVELRDLASAFNAMAEEIGRREEALRLSEARFEALYVLSQMTEASRKEIEDFVLEQEEKITKSEIGFIAFLNDDETACTTHAWSKNVTDRCAMLREHAHSSIERAGVWAEAVRKREPVIINDFSVSGSSGKTFPHGHVPLRRLMVVPVFDGNRIVAVAAVGNKEEEYNSSDARQLTLLMDGMWKHIQRRRAERSLREAESLAAIGRAMSAVAHDMRTPLIAIGGFASLVQKQIEEGTKNHERLGIVVGETQRLEKMVRDMLDFSRPLKLERCEGDINRLIADCLSVVEAAARERKVTLRSRPIQSGAPLSFDAARMKQVFINLLLNAIQASPAGECVEICCRLNGKNLFIDVVDHGCGIPSNDREEIFSPFFTTKKEGTGLGLPIVKKIVQAHKGDINILDNPERGITFRVLMPL
jgi:signal transduction histidine kinase